MYFKKLELVGFKSFLDKTTLQFEPGISAIVGPNGCGKSNIVDSIRWVLGEQSAKSLRGSEMQDVIFNGTDLKEPLGMAEVSLSFDNQQKFFNLGDEEVCITRRVFRSGESEYLLNKNPVRLKDIQDLLMGTGVGAESYSIVAQGKIDLVLSSRPEERRMVFDEASGITKYKAQKKEAVRKLEETEQNLLRVNDIIAEVRRQIGSLERQANKARKYKELFEELKCKEANQAFFQKGELIKEKEQNSGELKALQAQEEQFLKVVAEEEAKNAQRQGQLKIQQERLMSIKNQILSLENQIERTKEHGSFNREKIIELSANKDYLSRQVTQLRVRVTADAGKLSASKAEYAGLSEVIGSKSLQLQTRQAELDRLAASLKKSLETITAAKQSILSLAAKIANSNNRISDFSAKEQIYAARKKRLEIEKLKVAEEKAAVEEGLKIVTTEVESLLQAAEGINARLKELNLGLEEERGSLDEVTSAIVQLEKQLLALASHREFLDKLKTKYEDIGEAMNAVIYLDKLPAQKPSGLVVKIKEGPQDQQGKIAFNGEAKPIELDTAQIEAESKRLQDRLAGLIEARQAKWARIKELEQAASEAEKELHAGQIAISNKEASRSSIEEQFNKIKQEEELLFLELEEAANEISLIAEEVSACRDELAELNNRELEAKNSIVRQEQSILLNNAAREECLMAVTQLKTELESLNRRLYSDQDTLRIMEEALSANQNTLENSEKQINENELKIKSLESENSESQAKLKEFNATIAERHSLLAQAEEEYRLVSEGAEDYLKKIESERRELDEIKKKLHQLEMRGREIDYKYETLKERMLAAYKIDLEGDSALFEGGSAGLLAEEIAGLKKRLDSCGTVNLVAIEEYDELKKRYDFLLQQQSDLTTAKDSLHQAILKINRTTKQMFLATFEKVREEFRNYFRLLFNGGDAQLFIIDEQDPLESGIEIICRPPGKKLQNVLLLSGGEKSMSAIALIFAIFKVKPSPFCILDEIDAALDEANVERFSVILQEFVRTSQFIVITHNKRTIANANVMYGITMEQSGVSKIVSVKLAEEKTREKDKDLDADMAVV